jgi:hypothetical protein
MIFYFIDVILKYIILPLIVLFIVFLILLQYEPINLLWFSYVWEYYVCPVSIHYFVSIKKQLFKDIEKLKSSDPELIKENSFEY